VTDFRENFYIFDSGFCLFHLS